MVEAGDYAIERRRIPLAAPVLVVYVPRPVEAHEQVHPIAGKKDGNGRRHEGRIGREAVSQRPISGSAVRVLDHCVHQGETQERLAAPERDRRSRGLSAVREEDVDRVHRCFPPHRAALRDPIVVVGESAVVTSQIAPFSELQS
jgi:hypothetical protein